MKILVLLGAGASVPSGIPTFRGNTAGNYNFDFFDINYIKKNKKESIKFYKSIRKDFKGKNKNKYHNFLENIDKKYTLNIISQNIDELDYGLSNVIKLHGDINKNRCLNNYKHNISNDLKLGDRCNICNSYIIPDILYYNEKYRKEEVNKLNVFIKEQYDYFFIIGSSLEIGYIVNIANKIQSKHKININPEIELNEYINFKNYEEFNKQLGFIF